MRGLKGKTAIVTGGSRGIGKAIVRRLLEEDVKVLFCGRNADTGQATLAEMQKEFGNDTVLFMAGDMGDEQFCVDLTKKALSAFNGQLDFLVNSAFSFIAKAFDASKEDWMRTMEAGPIAYAKMTSEYAAQRGCGKGAIVNISSISGHVAQPMRWTYNTAKGAVRQLTKCSAMDLAPDVRVNCISPGWVWTDEIAKATPNGTRESVPEAWANYHLIQRLQEPEEIAAVVAFLLSDDASSVTGHDMLVDGGYMTMGPEGLGKEANYAGSE